jgi:hypothetical protein
MQGLEKWNDEMVKWWRRYITGKVRQYLNLKYGVHWKVTPSSVDLELGKDHAAIADPLKGTYHRTYWKWNLAFTLLFDTRH